MVSPVPKPDEKKVEGVKPVRSLGIFKRRGPCHPSGKVKETDRTNESKAIKCHGNLVLLDVKREDGTPAYKDDLNNATLTGKEGTEKSPAISVVSHKVEPTVDSKTVVVGQKKVPDKVIVSYFEGGLDENEEIRSLLVEHAGAYGKFSKPYRGTQHKPKARVGRLFNPDENHYADEHLFNRDVADAVAELYPDAMTEGIFDDDNAAEEILGQYFSLISTEEAKELVLDAYARKD